MKRAFLVAVALSIAFSAATTHAACNPPITDRYVLECCFTAVCVGGRVCPPCYWDNPVVPIQTSFDANKPKAGIKQDEPEHLNQFQFVPLRATNGIRTGDALMRLGA